MSVLLAVSVIFGASNYYRLVKTRNQLDNVRAELAAATDRQRDIGEIVSRANTILSESVNTVQGIREQIYIIRAVFEDMERRLYNVNDNDIVYDYKTNKLEGK